MARFDFGQGQAKAYTVLPAKYTLFGLEQFFGEIIDNGTDEKTCKNSHFKHVEVKATVATSDERVIVRSMFKIPKSLHHPLV